LKIASKTGRVAALMADKRPPEQRITDLYVVSLARRPSADELNACKKLLSASPSPQVFYEDLLWSLVNSKQFLFVR
jgi:hypothetical protein